MKKINKWFWVWNLEEEKLFLEEKAKEGLILKSVSLGSYTFEETQPRRLIFQMDFRGVDQKISEAEYIQLYEDAGWNFAARLAGWYYFYQEVRKELDLSIFNDNASKAAVYKRILAFLLITGFPLYFQVLFVFPNMSGSRMDFPNFYFFFRIFITLITTLHIAALIKIYTMYKKTSDSIRE
jgi:hypothetical protein